jgi:presenilin-like A22 family membrane protease
MDTKNIIPLLAMPALLLLVEIGAVLLSLPVQASGIVAFENPEDLANPIWFIAILLVFTAFLLLLIRHDMKRVIGAIIRISIFFTFCYIFAALVYAAMSLTVAAVPGWYDAVAPVAVFASASPETLVATGLVIILSLLASILLFKYPEWYVIDTLGVLIGAGVAAIFGSSIDVIPVLVLLVLLAAYDAISVYKTKHMITLAEGVIDQKTPILFVIPKRKDYSFIKEGVGNLADGGERAAFIIGMGDMIMPAILVVSANVFLKGWKIAGMINLPALGAIIGSVAGLAVLLHFVMSGKPQAGLPPICGGTILGFLVGWAAMG